MFDKFGEFDTYDEFKAAAKELMGKGYTNSIRELAEENGLDPLDAEDYITGETTEMTDPKSYAFARVEVERKNTKVNKPAAAYIAMIAVQVLSNIADQAHFKDRHFDKIMKAMEEKAKKDNVNYACGSDRDMAKIIEAYYLKSEAEMKKVVNEL